MHLRAYEICSYMMSCIVKVLIARGSHRSRVDQMDHIRLTFFLRKAVPCN